jgi:dodecin
MAVATLIEITASSTKSFEDAIERSIKRADKTLKNVRRAWLKDQEVIIDKGKVTKYRVTMNVSSVLKA